MIAEGKRRASETAHQERMTLAWNTAALHRAKRMPALKDLLGKKKREPRRKALGPDQLLTMARMWSAVAGPEGKEGV